jgi:hypothetical protein
MTSEAEYHITVDHKKREVGFQAFDKNDPHNCKPYEFGDLCGGCDNCLMMQAEHAGYDLAKVNFKGFETLGDAVGRIADELGYTVYRATFEGPDDVFSA